MSNNFIYQVMTKDGDGVLSAEGGREDVYIYTGAGTAIDLIHDTPYAQMLDDAHNGIYACEVDRTDVYSVVVGGVIVTGDAGIKIDGDPPREINLEPGETLQIKIDGKVYAEIGRGTSDSDIGFIKLPNAGGTDVHIYPNSEDNGVLADTVAP